MRPQIRSCWNAAKTWKRIAVSTLLLALGCQINTSVLAQDITKDKLHGYVAEMQGGAIFSTDVPTNFPSLYSIDLGTSGNAVLLVTNATFLNQGSSNDTLSFSFWEKRDASHNSSSAFWVDSPTPATGGRAFQAHVPWVDNTIYFDTDGCCDGNNQRISTNITTFVTYTDDADFWPVWHHFVFLKNGIDKQVWIDAQLLLDGTSSNALPTDMDYVWLGGGPAGNMNGMLSGFAISARL